MQSQNYRNTKKKTNHTQQPPTLNQKKKNTPRNKDLLTEGHLKVSAYR